MSLTFAISERCPSCGSRSFDSLPQEEITHLRKLAALRCCDCGATFEPPMNAETHPHTGDLVVRPRRDKDGFVIVLLGASAAQETRCAFLDDAVKLAARTAALLRSSVWQTNDGVTFDLVTSRRAHL